MKISFDDAGLAFMYEHTFKANIFEENQILNTLRELVLNPKISSYVEEKYQAIWSANFLANPVKSMSKLRAVQQFSLLFSFTF